MKKLKKKLKMILTIVLSLCMMLSVSIYPYAGESGTLGQEVEEGGFVFQTLVKGNKVSLMVSVKENADDLTGGIINVLADSNEFTLPEGKVTKEEVLTNAGIEPVLSYYESLKQNSICFEEPNGQPIAGNGKILTVEFEMPEDMEGTYNFVLSGSYVTSTWKNFGKVEVPFTIGDSETVKVTDITVNPDKDVLLRRNNDSTIQLTAAVQPESATQKNVKWSSSDTAIATVDDTGLVTAKSAGKVVITATAKDGSGVSGSCELTVNQGVKRVYYEGKTKKMLSVGETDTLDVVITPDNATDKTLNWSSSDPSVASVDENGRITGISEGTAVITVKANDGGPSTSKTYIVTDDAASAPAAKIGTNEYSTLQSAIDALKGGETITLLKDQQVGDIAINKECNLDLNGNILMADSFTVAIGTKMGEIHDGTLMSTSYSDVVTVKGELENLTKCTIDGTIRVTQATQSDQGESHKGMIDVMEDCTVKGSVHVDGAIARMDSCTVNGYVRAGGHGDWLHFDSDTQQIVKEPGYSGSISGLYDCTVLSEDTQYGVSVSDGGQIHIFSGTYNGKQYSAYCYRSDGYLEISGGRFRSETTSLTDVVQTGSGIQKDTTVVITEGYEVSSVADSDGYYEVKSVQTEDKTGCVSFVLSPSDAEITVTPAGEKEPLTPVTDEGNNIKYQLNEQIQYTYTVHKDGYQDFTGLIRPSDIQDNFIVKVSLEEQNSETPQPAENIIEGGDSIISGGIYKLKSGTSGIITVATQEPVTLVGDGTDSDQSGMYSDLTIDCVLSETDVTVKDLWIKNDVGQGTSSGETNAGMYLINFKGTGNKLGFEGTNILEKQEYTQYAGIHVPKNAELTINGTGKLYIYKYTQGSGIGGNSYEAGGKINITGGDLFIKGSKSGALIGGDSTDADVTNDPVTISGGNIVLINKARGAAIGSSHQGTCAGDVYLTGGNLTIISDYTGDAIGAGGNLYISGGSFKPLRTGNSLYGDGDNESQSVNDSLVTAAKYNGDGTKDVQLLIFDTSDIKSSNGVYTVSTNQGFTYKGGLHNYYYTESTSYTPDNFGYQPGDTNLYLYLPTDTKLLKVNGKYYDVSWNEETASFDVTAKKSSSGGSSSAKVQKPEVVAGEGGKVTLSEDGTSATITPDEGYTVKSVLLNDKEQGAVTSLEGLKTGDTVTVTFEAAPATVQEPEVVAGEGGKVTLSEDGTSATITPDEGYTVKSVLLNGKEQGAVTTLDGLKTGDTVTVTFEAVPAKSDRFIDVNESDWFYSVVYYVAEKGLMNGTSENTFSPDSNTTRGMLMTILARKAGIDTSGSDPWYQTGMEWAKAQGVSDGTNPEDLITREQVATMLYRFADSPEVTGNLDAFNDKSDVSAYAEKALTWAVEKGIMKGKGNGILDPKSDATRAEMAAMLMRFCEMK